MGFNAILATKVHRVSAALAAASAYDAPTPFTVSFPAVNIDTPIKVVFAYVYTLSVASGVTGDGFARVLPEVTFAGETFRLSSVDTSVVAANEIRVPIKELVLDLPNPPVDIVANVIVLELPPGVTSVAFPAAEFGDPDHPGTLASWVTVGV